MIENLQRKFRIADEIRIIYGKENFEKSFDTPKVLSTSLNFAVIAINETFDKPWSRLRATVNKNKKGTRTLRLLIRCSLRY